MNISREKLAETLRKVFPFHQLDRNLFNLLLEKADLVFFPDEKMIYKEGALAEAFYIVLEGEVDILMEVRQSLRYKNVIKPFFCFGEDIFSENARRRTSARALGDVVLIKISMPVMQTLRAEDNFFDAGISSLYASYTHLISKRFEKLPDETIAYISQPHPLPLIMRMFAALVLVLGLGVMSIFLYNNGIFSFSIFQWLAGVLTIACLAYMGWMYFEWSNDLFFFSNKRINSTKRTNLAFEEKQDTPLSAIESIQVRKNLFARMMNFGDLDIKTFTGATSISAVPNVSDVQHILQFLASRRTAVVERQEMASFQDEVRARINGSAAKSAIDPGLEGNEPEQELNDKLIKGIQDGEPGEEDLVIRTHWTILFSKIFIPAFLLLSLFLLYLFLFMNNFGIIESEIFNWFTVLFCMVLVGWSGYQFLDWRNDVFIITDNSLIDIDKRPFGMEEKRTAPISRIQSIRFKKKGIFGLLLNFGTVFIRIGDEEFTFNNIHRPAEVQDILFNAKDSVQKREDTNRLESERKRAVGWIDSYHQLVQEEKEDDTEDI